MSIERIYRCDSPAQNPDHPGYEPGERCDCHVQTATPPPYIPGGFLRVEEYDPDGIVELHFCCWDCLLRYAATKEMPEFIEGGLL